MRSRLVAVEGGADDHLTPHSLDAEQAVLGAILVQSELIAIVLTVIEARDFFRAAHRWIFDSMVALRERGSVIDFITLKDDLTRRGQLEDIGGPAYIASLTDGVPHSTNVEHYARIVKEHAARRALIQAANTIRAAAYDEGQEVARIAADAHAGLDAIEADGSRRTSRLVPDVEVMTWTSPQMLVEGRFRTNATVCVYGPSGLGKTFLMTGCSLSVAHGQPWLGAAITSRGSVVYVGAEGTAHFAARVRGWYAHAGVSPNESLGFYLFPEAVNLLDVAAVSRFIADAKAVQPVLVVIDTLARCLVGADENSAKDMGLAIAACDRIRKLTGATVVLVHHTGKDGGQERGSSALRGAVDTVIALTEDAGVLKLVCEKQKDGSPFQPVKVRLVAVLDGQTCVATLADGPTVADLSAPRLAALETLRRIHPVSGPVTKTEWFRALPPKAVSERRFYDVIDALLTGGLIAKEGKKRFRPG
jgi:hypothetical protein